MGNYIKVEKNGGIAVVTIDRPEVRNALNSQAWQELRDTMLSLDDDESVHVIVITGAGDKAFVAGADLNSLKSRSTLETLSGTTGAILREIETMKKPVIAAINGYALGGGCELALACDIRIAGDNAKLGQTEINVGVLPGAGGTQRLTRLVGTGKALELILTGAIISASEAQQIGLVNKVVPQKELMTEVMALAEKIAAKSPIITRLAKAAVKYGAATDLNASLVIETLSQTVAFSTEDHLEGINAFLEKRQPRYKGC